MIKTIKSVAVITPYIREFKHYSRDNAVIGTEYIHVYSKDQVRGRHFCRRVLIGEWRNIHLIDEILEMVATRISCKL